MTEAAPYQLLDCGDGRRLEEVGPWRFDRQAAQAFWPRVLPRTEWERAGCVHVRSERGGGHWEFRSKPPEPLIARHGGLLFGLKPTPFGHLGLFPEHAAVWDAVREGVAQRGAPGRKVSVLNLFAYTGGASLAAASAGASVVHVDASSGAVAWARANAALNALEDRPIRWIEDDCPAFLAREKRRDQRHDIVILDPPSFGRGPKGEIFELENTVVPLLESVRAVLADGASVYFSCHTAGFTPLVLNRLGLAVFGDKARIESHEVTLPVRSGGVLPSGVALRVHLP